MKKNNWLKIIQNLKMEYLKKKDIETAAEFREIENWLNFKHPIEEIFESNNSFNDVVKKELKKLERLKKLEQLNEKKK